MNHEEYERMVQKRRNAILKFPSLFKNFHLKEDASLDELNRLYNCYVNAQKQNEILDRELKDIKGAYEYVSDLIKNRYIPDNSKISRGTYEQYHLLIDTIGQYKFNVTKNADGEMPKTVGYYQNLNSKDILFELSILEPSFNDMMSWIDFEYEIFSNEAKNKIISMCVELGTSLSMSYSFLAQAQLYYQQKKPNAKRNWRKAKNISYRDILRFYEKLTNELHIENLDSGKTYNRFLIELKRSPHYYCFLTKEEINEQSKKNKKEKYKVKKRIRQ